MFFSFKSHLIKKNIASKFVFCVTIGAGEIISEFS